MADFHTRYSVGDTIRFIGKDGRKQEETVQIIELQKAKVFGIWIMYGYGDLFKIGGIRYVSEHKIRKDQEHFYE